MRPYLLALAFLVGCTTLSISVSQAPQHIHTEQEVCGTLIAIFQQAPTTRLVLAEVDSSVRLNVLIPDEAIQRCTTCAYTRNKPLCVRGTIETDDSGALYISVNDPSALSVP